MLLSIALLTILFGPDYLRPRGLPAAEFAAMLLFAITGGMLIAGARDLLLLFLALELLVLPGYLLAGYAKRDGLSTEGAIKYFLLGSFSSAIFLFGLVLTFGYTGTTNIREIAAPLSQIVGARRLHERLSPALLMGLALLTTGAAFKIAAVPFHYWTPDAYQGSPTPVTGYLSVGPKVAAFALILRLFVDALGGAQGRLDAVHRRPRRGDDDARQPGRPVAGQHQAHARLQLDRAHRLHPGRPGRVRRRARPARRRSRPGLQAVLFYSVAYSFMNLGAFAVRGRASAPAGRDQPDRHASPGSGRRAPLLAALMLLFLLSLTGIPPLAGFWAKWYVIQAALQVGGWLTCSPC